MGDVHAGAALRRAAVGGGLAAALALVALALVPALDGGDDGASGPATPSAGGADATPEPRGALVWREDFEGASQFRRTPWNHVPRAPTRPALEDAREGDRVGRYRIPGSPAPGVNPRAESVPEIPVIRPGDDLWFAFATRLEEGVPLDTTAWQVLAQWKDEGDGSPPLALYLRDGRFHAGGGYGNPGGGRAEERDLGAATTGRWVDWVFHVRFSSDPAEAYVSVWRDGRLALDRWAPSSGTLYPGLGSYLKLGYYRSADIRTDASVLHDDWRVWTRATRFQG